MDLKAPWSWSLYATDDDPEVLRKLGITPVRALTNDGQVAIRDAEGSRVALVDPQTPSKRGQAYKVECPERDCRANLISAAPDMLTALRESQALLEEAMGHANGGFLERLQTAYASNRTILAKV